MNKKGKVYTAGMVLPVPKLDPEIETFGQKDKPMGATGWWLILTSTKSKWAEAMELYSVRVGNEIIGFTYSPAEVLAWVREGKLPGNVDFYPTGDQKGANLSEDKMCPGCGSKKHYYPIEHGNRVCHGG